MWKFSTWEICLFSICLFLQPSIYMDSYLLYFGLQSHTTLFSDSDGSSFDSFSVSSCSQPPCPLMHHHTLWTLQDAPDSSDVFPILDLWEFVSMEKKLVIRHVARALEKQILKHSVEIHWIPWLWGICDSEEMRVSEKWNSVHTVMKLHERWETASKGTNVASEDTLGLVRIFKRHAQKMCDWTQSF